MRHTRDLSSLWWLTGPLLLTLACSHHSPRDNPLDPTLTPPVQLQVALDDTAGTATLTWTKHQGEAVFAEYWVLRNIDKSTEVDTLVRISDQPRAAYTDTSLLPYTDYAYRVSIVNAGGLEVTSPEVRASPLTLPPAEIRTLDFDSRTATATLTWTPYRGPRFQAYEVWLTHGTSEVLRHTESSHGTTAFVDTGLHGNTNYSYIVSAVTERGEVVRSAPASGDLHGLEVIWPLHNGAGERVRLSHDGDGGISATTTWIEGTPFPLFTGAVLYSLGRTTAPAIVEELIYPFSVNWGIGIKPAAMATQIVAPDTRWTALSGHMAYDWRLKLFSSDRDSLTRRTANPNVLAGQPPLVVPAESAEVPLVVSIWPSEPPVYIYSIAVYDDGEEIYVHDFAQGLPPDWLSWRSWSKSGYVAVEERVELSGDAIVLGWGTSVEMNLGVPGQRSDRARVEVEMAGAGYVWIGGDLDGPHCILGAHASHEAYPPLDVVVYSSTSSTERLESELVPNYAAPRGRYTIALGIDSGTVEATVPGDIPEVVWSATDSPEEPLSPWISLAAVEDGFALLSVGDRLYSMSPSGQASTPYIAPLGGDITELRVWDDLASGMHNVGICVPDRHSVFLDQARPPRAGRVSVSSTARQSLGDAVGPGPGSLLFPLSLAVGPNGRMYALDAGNSRIQVFGPEGDCITQWGGHGSGPGEFDFGQGMSAEDFRGSIAVDDEGYIFVADPGNQRIQVFAP